MNTQHKSLFSILFTKNFFEINLEFITKHLENLVGSNEILYSCPELFKNRHTF